MNKMVSVAVLVLFVAVCSAGSTEKDKSPAASLTRHTPQQVFLAKQNTGNFACRVNSLVVSTESPGEAGPDADLVKADMIKSSFANVATLEWAHIAQTSFSALDGRNDEKVLATPGGDLGEFIQVVHAYAKVTGVALKTEDIQNFLERFLATTSREKFSYETDERSYMRLAVATGCRNLHVSEMGGMRRKKEAFLEQVMIPDHIGDPFIRFLSKNATELDLNHDYIYGGLAAFHNILWTSPSKMSEKLCYLEVKGAHKEAALINIKLPSFCTDSGLAPMVSQQLACSAPVFVNHPGAAKLLRREMVAVLTDGTDVDPKDVLAVANVIAETNMAKFWAEAGAGLPTITVEFMNSSPLLSNDEPQPEDDN